MRGRGPAALAVAIVLLALAGPWLAPHAPDLTIGAPFAGPSGGVPLGTDYLGRDVLSRLLAGGRIVVGLSALSALCAYAVGLAIGLAAAYYGGWVEIMLMRGVDILLSLPPLVLIPAFIVGAGRSASAIVGAVVLVSAPEISRIVRAATRDALSHDYVSAAIAGGERAPALLVREVLPNLAPTLLADLGIRFVLAAYIVATLSFLGIGLSSGAPDWAQMIGENRTGITAQPWAVAAPALLIALLIVSVNLALDRRSQRLRVSAAAP